MNCRAYRNFCINSMGFCPFRLDLSNLVDFSDPFFAFPSGLNIQFWVSGLHIEDSFFLIVSPCVDFQVFIGSGCRSKPWRSR